MSLLTKKLEPGWRIRLDSDDLYVLEVYGFQAWVWMFEGSTPEECYAAYELLQEGERPVTE